MLLQFPYLIERIQSTLIDVLCMLFATFAAGYVFDRFEEVPDWVRIAVFVGIWILYEPTMTTTGGTIGNRLKGIQVRRFSNIEKKINFPQALIRYSLKLLLGWISFLTINGNTEKRAIHDFAAGSVMIKLVNEQHV